MKYGCIDAYVKKAEKLRRLMMRKLANKQKNQGSY